ncbi:hypothetical protein AUEXF2481DRAFT_63259 [Aureobasidium subglaciale EXF-2481]|uniref:Cupin type-1 domain-containing protein n=1 Tax=Aureobasidium subglaciale (strain EXF-2481) TaxID=1043005 RepID=A0A074YNI2_AURSE|nr:uncharacterized protein AUEXF2481DRAFT_63259 [Aureobasidium subglaciale EXF-2481]KAI5195068.1 hypothetical protein E4T38_09270 [Aureobasidium subglaciale]KAI5214120.1 hypothetical protein E4T40_09221 [Aureobasidium subglaciale]KAI5216575.1 hypothetical protein E4T41_09222 [Aureobasidium subglaciale]KAI5254456.1 hypothetical protein E4T46_09177 [Aureobasidium subglaciale]KEQ97649.1 hypothetical protein AUEXF2481DRAFT_63259 [Aureobasidium subglaciale EXF-2481]
MATSNILTPLKEVKISKHQIPAHGLTPNTSIQKKPLLLYRNVFIANTSAGQIEEHLRGLGVVEPAWRYTMYSTSHFHTTSHEVLCISSGSASLCFGHEDNPSCVKETVKQGDVIIVPAGVAHRLLEDLEGGFEMVGSYPKGKSWDMCYGKRGEEGKVKGIGGLGWFGVDPVYGVGGPAVDV